MALTVPLGLLFALGGFPLACCLCPSQCCCFYHSLNDGSRYRSVICNDPEISQVPASFPVDTSKLRIEQTAIQRIPSEAFNYLTNLEFLWMPFNALSSLNADSFRGLFSLEELRLDGNCLTSFPWDALMDMPCLRLLDLHNNQLSSISPKVTVYMKNVTYLDLSSNNLLTVPLEMLATWLLVKPAQRTENSRKTLGLHDNPWLCDCRLYDLVQFQKSPLLSVTFIDTKLRCSEPGTLSGVLFSDAELTQCQGPRVYTAVARIRSKVGNNVLLRCGTAGVPVPELVWERADGKTLNGTSVQQENSNDGIVWSILSVPAVSFSDSGKYICKATNYAGTAEAVISLIINEPRKELQNRKSGNMKKSREKKPNPIMNATYQERLIARHISPSPVVYTNPHLGKDSRVNSGTNTQPSIPEGLLESHLRNLAPNTSTLQQDPDKVIHSVKVIGDTDHTVCLIWRVPKVTNTTVFSVFYAIFGKRDMHRINVSPGNNKIIIKGLVPKTKYIACVCIKGLIPKKEQCVIFSTDVAVSANGTQKLINVIVITVACVIAVPLTIIVCCGALKRKIQKFLIKNTKDIQDTHATVETSSSSTKTKGLEVEYLTRLNTDESNKLLSHRSCLDSESTAKIEEQSNEYLCGQFPSATTPPHSLSKSEQQYLCACNLDQLYLGELP